MTSPFPARRILIYGVCGSGKTVFAERLSRAVGIPWHSVDDLTWLPGWKPVPDEDQRQKIAAICGEDRWILDTAYGKWLEIPLSRADLIVGLDYPRWFSLMRLLRRTAMRAIDGKRICNGNVETWRQALSRDSIIHWHFKSFPRKRARIRAWQSNPPVREVIAFTRAWDAEKWLRRCGNGGGDGDRLL